MLTLIDLKYGTEIFLRRDWSELSDAENFKVMTSFWLDYWIWLIPEIEPALAQFNRSQQLLCD